MIVTPQLRSGVACLGEDYCYPLAFGVPAALMFVALLVFGIGRVVKLYKINMPDRTQENLIKKTLRCIWVGCICKWVFIIILLHMISVLSES